MRVLCLLFIINAVLAHHDFGRAYMRRSKLCHQWKCLNSKLGLPDALPSQEDFQKVLTELLPPGPWQDVVETVVEACYHDRDRKYTNTCPGQAILHCTIDQLNNNCPEQFTVMNDACAPITSLAGFENMFTQSRYENLETNIQFEKRPAWFLRHYFSKKCCNFPDMFNSTVLTECDFSSLLSYYVHKPNFATRYVLPSQQFQETPDPLDCCDMSHFITEDWRRECNFKLSWEGENRLVPNKGSEEITTEVPTANSERTLLHRDVVVLPETCEKTTCVFNKMESILNENGSVNIPIFMKLLDNFTSDNPSWYRAKARVVTTCLSLSKPLQYEGECELNKILACTFDVLTENCPHSKKNDTCKHSHEDKICQISSSKYRPKHRRDTCILPEIVNKLFLDECGIQSLTKTEQINQYTIVKKFKFSYKHKCQDLTPSMSCVLSKMGTLNEYGFLDYFKMKDKIRSLPVEDGSSNLNDAYIKAFIHYRLYREHCNSPRKFLNLLDSMILTCPDSKRSQTPQCRQFYQNVTSLNNQNRDYLHNIKLYPHVFLPFENHHHIPKYTRKIVKKPIFNYGLLNSEYAPKVQIIDIKPKKQVESQQPLVLLPVYMRVPNNNLLVRPYDPSLRKPFWLHNAIAQSHGQSTISPLSTKVSTSVPISTMQASTTEHSTTPVSTEYDSVSKTIQPPTIWDTNFQFINHDHEKSTISPISTTQQYSTTDRTSTTEHISTTPVSNNYE